MTIEEIRKQLIEEGLNPEKYAILLLTENGYQIWEKEFAPNYAKFAMQEDIPIKEDVDIVAETSVYTMMDIQDLAEMLVTALERISELEGKING